MNNHELIELLKSTSEIELPVGITTENRTQDFKKELNIDTKADKGKFLKHIIALANAGGKDLSCIYYGIEENSESKIFSICGVDTNSLQSPDSLKDIIRSYIYPSVNVDIITIYNEKLFSESNKGIQVIKIENNSSRPYRFKQTIGSFVEGEKYYRDNHNSCRIPALQEDEMIRKWTLEDAGLIKRIFKNIELLGLVAAILDLFSRVPNKYLIDGLPFIIGLIVTILLDFLDKVIGNYLTEEYKGFRDKNFRIEKNNFFVIIGNLLKLIFYAFVVLICEFLLSLFVFSIYSDADEFICSPYAYYPRCEIGFLGNLLWIFSMVIILTVMLFPFIPWLGKAIKTAKELPRGMSASLNQIRQQLSRFL